MIAKGIIERGWLRSPTLVGNLIPMLSPTLDTKECGAPVPKHTIANANTRSWSRDSSGKRQQTGCPSNTTGNCCIEGGKVVGTIEGLHYEEGIWNTMSPVQKAEVVRLQCQSKPAQHSVQAMITSGPTPNCQQCLTD